MLALRITFVLYAPLFRELYNEVEDHVLPMGDTLILSSLVIHCTDCELDLLVLLLKCLKNYYTCQSVIIPAEKNET